MSEYLRAFVIGSSFFVFGPFFYFVSKFDTKKFHVSYTFYTLIAPVGLGIMNMAALWIAKNFDLSRRKKYLLMSILAPTVILFIIYFFNVYTYTKSEWIQHIISLYISYFFIINVIVYSLDKYV